MKKLFFLSVIIASNLVLAQNTQREPIGGGTTNPVTQREAKDPNFDPNAETRVKKKSKVKVTPTPAEEPVKEQEQNP